MNNIEDILRALADDGAHEDSANEPEKNGASENKGGGLFDGLDIDALMKIMDIFEKFNKPDDNEKFLLALKPLLREENRGKIDAALKFMKLFALLPLLKDSGVLGKLL